MPQASFIENVMTLAGHSTQEITQAKDYLVNMAKERKEFPTSRLILRRKKRNELDSSFQHRLAVDCYKLFQFIEGGSVSMIHDLFRPMSVYEHDADQSAYQDCSDAMQTVTLDKDLLISLQSTLHQTVERLGVVEGEVNLLRGELQKARDDHNGRRKDIELKNREKEKDIRDNIARISEEGKSCQKSFLSIKGQYSVIHEEMENQKELHSQRNDCILAKVKELNRGQRDVQLSLSDINCRIASLSEPNDALFASLKSRDKNIEGEDEDN
jgi:hypothetical protein